MSCSQDWWTTGLIVFWASLIGGYAVGAFVIWFAAREEDEPRDLGGRARLDIDSPLTQEKS